MGLSEVVAVEDFLCGCPRGSLSKVIPLDSWILACHSQWLPLVPGDLKARFQRFRLALFFTDQAMDIVMAINMGGDDFFNTKPFGPKCPPAKVQGLLRRSYEFGGQICWSTGSHLTLKSTDLVYEGSHQADQE